MELDRARLEAELAQLPLYQYAFLRPQEVPFSERLQQVCRLECPMYGKSWSCPPAVGSAEECRRRCLAYDGALLLVSMQEAADAADLAQTLALLPFHTQITERVRALLQEQGQRTLCLSAEACARCGQCAWPQSCRQPEKMTPCMEGYGIVVSALAERYGVPFPPENGWVAYYALIFYTNS